MRSKMSPGRLSRGSTWQQQGAGRRVRKEGGGRKVRRSAADTPQEGRYHLAACQGGQPDGREAGRGPQGKLIRREQATSGRKATMHNALHPLPISTAPARHGSAPLPSPSPSTAKLAPPPLPIPPTCSIRSPPLCPSHPPAQSGSARSCGRRGLSW